MSLKFLEETNSIPSSINAKLGLVYQCIFNLVLTTTHHWRNSHFTSIKCLCGVGDKGQGLSFQEGTSHTYTFRLSYSRIIILYNNNNNNNNNK